MRREARVRSVRVVVALILLVATLLVALSFLQGGTLGGNLDQPAESISGAPGQ